MAQGAGAESGSQSGAEAPERCDCARAFDGAVKEKLVSPGQYIEGKHADPHADEDDSAAPSRGRARAAAGTVRVWDDAHVHHRCGAGSTVSPRWFAN